MNFLRWNRATDRCSGKYAKNGYASSYVDKLKGYVHRRRYSYSSSEDESPTFGRFMPPSDKKGYASNASNKCPCVCCPHSSPASSSSASPSATSTSRRRCGSGRLDQSEDPKDDRPPESSKCGPSSNYNLHRGGRQESTIKKEVPSERRRLISSRRGGGGTTSGGHRDSRAEHEGSWSIYVVDRTDKSRSKHRDGYGGLVFHLSLSGDTTATEIMDRLAPGGRDKVVVHWKDGAQENFDEYVSARDAREYAAFLEVKRRKTVHWRYDPV